MPPEGLLQLSGGILYTLCLGANGRHLLDLDQIRVLRQSLRLLRGGQLDVQDAILELCVDGRSFRGYDQACSGFDASA